MYIKLTSIFLLLAILLCFASCSKNNEDGQKLKYYTINNEDSVCVELIQKYNNYCLKNLDESYQIEIVEFDSEDTMLTKISTEIMAGEGPDIISLNQKLPFEKLIDNGSFADIDELAELYKSDIDFDDYNSTIMDCGIYNGKRYIIPIAYCPNILITTQEILDKYNLENTNFSFKELEIRLSDKDHSYALFGNKDETYKFFFSYVNEYVDFYNKTTEFSSDEFTESLDYIGKMIRNDNSRKEGTTWDITGNYLFRTSQLSFDGSMMSTLNSYFYIYNNNSTPVIIPNYNKKANAVSAFVQCGIALNNNSNNKEKALAFIQYVLSYDIQKLWSESSLSPSIVVRALPVNKAAFEYVIDHTSKCVYDINDDGEYEKSEEEYSDEIKTKFFNEYLDMINSISSCTLYDYLEFENTYYNSSVIGDIVNDYLNGDISKEKFIRQLTAATEIYLTE
ncbi:ABC transporter substrate-binding protein [Ruminococcus intestinalis]|uniref:ABC transporter substrate-binding protein n=1 Tax=Ruminococcus intestinalis TaxID=2763066 RepID=UPI003F7F72A9